MPQQLTIFDYWEEVAREPLPRPAPVVEVAPEPIPVLPGQQSLLGGVHLGEAEVDRALERRDPETLRAVSERTLDRYPHYAAARVWPLWAAGLSRLATGTPAEHLEAAERLVDPSFAAELFPDMTPDRFGGLYCAAVLQAARDVLSAHGSEALGPDGRPVALILLRFDLPREARPHFEAFVQAHPGEAAARRALARCLAATGAFDDAHAAWLCAALLEPATTANDAALPAELADALADAESLDLPGEPAEWLPALADLTARAALPPPERLPPPRENEPAGVAFVRTLAALRALRRRRAPEPEVRPLKALLLKAAPALKERLRGV